jgi:hypothetical protein
MYELQLQYPVIYEGISLKSATLPYFCENFSQRLATNFLLKWENSTRQYKIPIIYLWEPNPEWDLGLKTSANALWNVFEDVLSKLSSEPFRRAPNLSKFFKIFQIIFSHYIKSQTLPLIIIYNIKGKWSSCSPSNNSRSVPQATPRASFEGPHFK